MEELMEGEGGKICGYGGGAICGGGREAGGEEIINVVSEVIFFIGYSWSNCFCWISCYSISFSSNISK